MKQVVVCLGILGFVHALPSGLYHQEYNYKSSAATYQNNELQHKTDDQGFYSKDGDFEGRVKPRVSSNSEHSEYVNPKIRDYNTVFTGDLVGDTSSYGHMRAETTYGTGRGKSYLVGSNSPGTKSGSYHDLEAEGLATADNIAGTRALYGLHHAGQNSDLYGAGTYGSSAYGSNAYGSSAYGSGTYGSGSKYGSGHLVGSSSSYQASSVLSSISSRVENELQRELQSQLQSNLALAELETNLRQKISERLEDAIRQQYGQQSIRDGFSYTISEGRLQPTANFQQQEYLDLRRQLETNLLQRLRTEYNRVGSSQYTSSASSSQNEYYNQNYVHATTRRPYSDYGTERPMYIVQPVAPQLADIRYTPIPNPESITTIASRVQNSLDERLNQLLEETQQKYFSSSSYYKGNVDSLLDRLREELRRNITYHLDEQIRNQYGTQIQKDGYMYSVGPSGQHSTKYNYNANDLANLRRQIESNLLEKLNKDFTTYKTRWQSQQSSSYRETNSGYDYTTIRAVVPLHIGPNYGDYDYTTPRYDNRPTSASIAPLISGTKGGHRYTYSASGGYQVSGTAGQRVAELQRQLQMQLGRQVQEAISRNEATRQSYANSGYGSAQSYDTSYQRLYDELNRNLTRQLQEFQYDSSSGYGSSAYNDGFDEAQLAQLRAQLQQDLTSQLQQGLQQSYRTTSSYSAHSSSSSSNHAGGAYRADTGYGQYRTGGVYPSEGEDCLGDDSNSYGNLRMKRSVYSPYRSRPLGLSGTAASNYGYYGTGGGTYGPSSHSGVYNNAADSWPVSQNQVENHSGTNRVHTGDDQAVVSRTGQNDRTTSSDLTQQSESQNFGQVEDDSDIRAHTGNYQEIGGPGRHRVSIGSQLEEQTDNFDLSQQVENQNFGGVEDHSDSRLTANYQAIGGPVPIVSQPELQGSNTDLTQQAVDDGFGRTSVESQQQIEDGQKEDETDLTQQVEDGSFGSIDLGSQRSPYNKPTNRPATASFSNSINNPTSTTIYPYLSNQLVGQLEQNFDTQHEEDTRFGKPQQGNQQSQYRQSQQLGQQPISEIDNTNFVQQVENDDFGKLQIGPQNNPKANDLSGYDPMYISNANIQLNSADSFKPLQTPTQTKITKQLEDKLTRQIEEACKQLLTSTTSQQISYQRMLNELNRNISSEIRNLQQEGYKFSVNFDDQQTLELQQQLQYKLKALLQSNIQKVYGQRQKSIGQELEDIDLLQKQESNSFNNWNKPNQNNKPVVTNHHTDSDFSQQETGFRQLNNINKQVGQQLYYDRDLSQQTEGNDNTKILSENQHNEDYNKQQQIEDSYLIINTGKPYRQVNNGNTYDFHRRETGQQNQYYPSSNLGTLQESNFPSLNQVPNQNQPSIIDQNLQGNINPTFVDGNGLTQNQEKLNRDRLHEDISVTPESHILGTQLPSNHIRPRWNTLESHNYANLAGPSSPGIQPYANPGYESEGAPLDLQPSSTLQNENIYPQNNGIQPKINASPNPVTLQSNQSGTSFDYASQGQLVTNKISREEANRQAELLLEQIRKIQQSQAQLSSTNQYVYKPQTQFSGNINANGQTGPMTDSASISPEGNTDSESREDLTVTEITLSKNQLAVAKQLEDEVVKQLDAAVQNQYNSARSYMYAYNQLKEQLHQNLTEFIVGATEPGLSQFSEQISNNFKGQEINNLQNLLEKRCSQKLEQKLQEIYYGYSYNHHSSHSYNSHSYISSNSHNHSPINAINYGQPSSVETGFEIASEIQPHKPQQANMVEIVPGGVKGGRRHQPQLYLKPVNEPGTVRQSQDEISPLQQPAVSPDQQVEVVDQEVMTTEKPGWWKRFGNKVKEGANSLKQKVGL